jgi:uncharacterized protein
MGTRKHCFTLDELIDRITPENMQELIDFGPDVGNEIVVYEPYLEEDEELKSEEKVFMERDTILELLREHQEDLARLGVASLALFGSLARGQAGPESDIDLLVEFNRPVGFFAFLDVQFYLEKLLGRKVDLVTPDALRPSMRDQILREAVNVA